MNSNPLNKYRPNVGICLINDQQQVFMATRIDMQNTAWQMPQGGIDAGESIEAAAQRELLEETGISSIEILKIYDQWFTYDFPTSFKKRSDWTADYKGQKQKWVLAKFVGDISEINLQTAHPEFDAWQWMDAQEALTHIVAFKKDVYQQVFQVFNL